MSKKEMLIIARERISILHERSLTEKTANRDRARRHVQIMEGIAKRADITLSPTIKRSYCKECKTPYGEDSRVRLKTGKIVLLTCGSCGNRRRFSIAI